MLGSSRTTASAVLSRFELAAEVRLSLASAEAEACLTAVLRSHAVTRLGSLGPELRSFAGHAVVGVLARQAHLGAGRLAWTLIEVRPGANRPEACACAIVPAEVAASAAVGHVVCLLAPSMSISTSRTALLLRAAKPAQVLVLGRARDCGKCARCGMAVNLRYGSLCAVHQATAAVRVKCDRLDVASQAPRCQIVGLPVRQHRQLSTGAFRLDGAQLVIDKRGHAALDAPDGSGADDELVAARLARARDESSERALLERFPPQPRTSIGARYLKLVNDAAHGDKAPPPRAPAAAARAFYPPAADRGAARLPAPATSAPTENDAPASRAGRRVEKRVRS
ncbi:hypothetical protein KFE25_001159 [Diacronema lutheri]|uniref:Uncharacterized protein n=1 Tax=Diacronema lutheri TaxID=2081491 RepID=A0A8J6C9G0_DIALT|nr:hypothetical protein KFE25_001159 [Diacronema lutheri]